jgi:hypothetical protein
MSSMTSGRTALRLSLTAVRIGAVVSLLAVAGACGSAEATTTTAPEPTAAAFGGTVISPARLIAGQAVPAPAEKPVFTMAGKISATNSGGALVLDRATIEQLSVHQVELYEPWVKKDMMFRGVWLQDLLAVAGVAPGATRLHITALDDYAVDISLADIKAGGIMLATRTGDGSVIPIDEGGPTRIVFMDDVKAGANADQWVWSLKSIDVI